MSDIGDIDFKKQILDLSRGRESLSSYLNVLVENVEEIRTDMNNLTEKIDDDLNAIIFKVGNAIESIKPFFKG